MAIRAILESLRGTDKRFLYTSGSLVYGNTGDTAATEDAPLNPFDLVRWRPGLESEILGAAAEDVHAIVIRPTWVYGYRGGTAMMMAGAAHEYGVVHHVGAGQNRWTPVHADDLADLYALALERGAAGSVYNGAEGGPIRLIEIARAASEVAAMPGRVEAWPLEEAREVLGAFVDAIAFDQPVSGAKARRELGWTLRAPQSSMNCAPMRRRRPEPMHGLSSGFLPQRSSAPACST